MKTIYFVRHAESEANAAGIMAGSEHDIPLTELGKQQAKQAGKDLTGKNIQLIVASPMIRTQQTAAIIAKEIGYDKEKILFSDLLVERNFGHYEAKPREIYLQDHQAQAIHESVENDEILHGRAMKLFEEVSHYRQQIILLVSHGSFGRAVKAASKKLDHSHVRTIEAMGNAEVFEFQLED